MCAHKRKKKMASSQKLCYICLKTSLFEAKLCYNVLKDYFTMKAMKSRGAKNKLHSERNQGQQVSNFPSDFCCNKNIFTFILQISRSEWLLTFVLNVKKCLNAKRETLLSVYLLITEIYTY